MSLQELIPTLRELDRADKLRAVQFLINEIAKEELPFEAGKNYPIWSPYDSHAAANMMLGMLEAEKQNG